ncbi:MAG: GrpB family protein [Oscillospiraceae bacterium]|nr:GrpB family protein [Oscillospiraceae bacterium]
MIGLKRGAVILCEHDKEWKTEAQKTISLLKKILGNIIKDIQHVGSTSIVSIKAKPIIDIAIAVDNFEDILTFEEELKSEGFYYRPNAKASVGNQLLFACGSFYDGTGDLQTHFIHVVHTNSTNWINYINFRDYLRHNPLVAQEYEKLKLSLAEQTSSNNGREKYTDGKHDFIAYTLRKALVKSYLGKMVNIKIDRPVGSIHPKHPDIIYPVNYGFLPNVFGGDGEELDVYLLGVDVPVKEYTARVICIVHRHNDVEDKLVAAPEGVNFTKEGIAEQVNFQEQYYDNEIEMYS